MKIRITALLLLLWSCAAFCAAGDNAVFQFQGRVSAGDNAFSGTGKFKLAIVNTSGTVSLWSNDGTSIGGAEPTGHITADVVDGIFSILVGDANGGMVAINSSIFNSPTPLKLRVWFDDGEQGFEQLDPDTNLVNLTLEVLSTGSADFTIYVNGATGDDQYNGLSPTAPKKTIQAAVDTLPGRINSNVTIDVADGVYQEVVRLHGIYIIPEKSLTIVGDETWTPTLGGSPTVRITGADNLGTPVPVRNYGIYAANCSGLVLQGLHVDYAANIGARMDYGSYKLERCKLTHNGVNGFQCHQSDVTFVKCLGSYNTAAHGFALGKNSWGSFTDCEAQYNGFGGVSLNTNTHGNFYGTGNYSNNAVTGLHIILNAAASFAAAPGYVGQLMDNGTHAVQIWGRAYSFNLTSTNTMNKPIYTDTGGTYYN